MKRCTRCGVAKAIEDFHKNKNMAGGYLHQCKDCVHESHRVWRETRLAEISKYKQEWNKSPRGRMLSTLSQRAKRARNPEKYRARTAVGNAVRDGRLVRQPCGICGSTDRLEAHHEDYSKPLDVTWLCYLHHRESVHGQRVLQTSDHS